MDGPRELVIVVRVVGEPGLELSPEELDQLTEWVMTEVAGEIEQLAASERAAAACRQARYRAATQPCMN